MRRPVPRIIKFNDRDPAKHTLYPMPLPHGPRVIAVTDGKQTNMLLTDGTKTITSLNGFVPHIESAVAHLYDAMMSEPQPGITLNGHLKYRPGVVFDMILHDRQRGGAAGVTEATLDEWIFDETQSASEFNVCALVLATVPLEAFQKGKDDKDLWLRRSHIKRGCMRLGAENVYADRHPIIRAVTIAPGDWAAPDLGCAGQSGPLFWKQVDNCFLHGYAGCLIMDVMQPWNASGDHFQLIREEDAF